ncbi:hypothetical protein [Chitinophaga sp. MM2321]|uniref:hypothetical protein n=1 Tax=Chitinophaga sp. MM2321 TaxID=3137178 RepID=UPI0032D59068
MNRNYFLTVISVWLVLMSFSCGQNHSSVQNTHMDNGKTTVADSPNNDSIALMQAFDTLKKDKKFLNDLALEGEKKYAFSDLILKPFFGDLNNDGITDALVAFSVEGRGGGNNSDLHYAVFLNRHNQWEYQSQLDGGGNWAERFIAFDEIKNGKITGNLVGNKDESLPGIPVEYVFKNGKLMNTQTALHKTENEKREYLRLENITTPTGKLMPLTGTLEEYEQIMGKGKISTPEEQPECGTYFGEGTYSELYYAHRMMIELQNGKKAAWRSVLIHGSNYQINTDKGTITGKTTLDELKNIFYNENSWQIEDRENGGKTFSIPDGPESDNQLRIDFSKEGVLEGIYLFMPC